MKSKIAIFSTLFLTIFVLSFKDKNEISKCFISFTTPSKLTAAEPDRLPKTSEKVRTLPTEKGDVEVSRIDGYRILFNNEKKAPFVNLKVELSAPGLYETDKNNLLEHLKYINAHSSGMETKDLLIHNVNGYKISGLSRATIETGSTLGEFVMFPGNGVTVYFYFNNLKSEFRNFKSVEDYKIQRDRFIEE